jgi:hypothetical protein
MNPNPTKLPSERRKQLFRDSRPLVRKLVIREGEDYTKDIRILWAAYKAGSFKELPQDMDQESFLAAIEELQKSRDQIWLIDDKNPAYKDKAGPVAMACTSATDLVVSTEGCAFKWATKRNVLRCSVAFLHMIRRNKATGICMVKSTKEANTLMRHLSKIYKELNYVGRASKDAYLYAGRGSQ